MGAIRTKGRPPPGRAVAELAARQHGVVGVEQLHRLGLSAPAVKRRVAEGSLHRLHRGVYAVGHPETTFHGRLLASLLAIGSGAAISHRSAAALWGFRAEEDGPVEVTTERRVKPRAGIRVHRTRHLARRDITQRHRIVTTTPARTLLDIADALPARELRRAVHQAEVLRLVAQPQLHAQLAGANGRRGAKRLAEVIAPGYLPTRSELEDIVLDLINEAGLPQPRTNAWVGPHEVDLLFPTGLIVECDGGQFHDTPQARKKDQAKQAALEARGHPVLRISWDQATTKRDQTKRRLQQALAPS